MLECFCCGCFDEQSACQDVHSYHPTQSQGGKILILQDVWLRI